MGKFWFNFQRGGKALLETPKEGMQNKTRRRGNRRERERGGFRVNDEAGREMEWRAESFWVCQLRGKVGQGGGVQRVGMLKSPIQPLASSPFFPCTPSPPPPPPCLLWCPSSSFPLLTVNDCPPPRPQQWSVITTAEKDLSRFKTKMIVICGNCSSWCFALKKMCKKKKIQSSFGKTWMDL